MKFFNDCNTLDEAKTLFRKLCVKLHPDTSGYNSSKDFIKMYAEFKSFRPTVKRESDEDFNADAFYNIIKKFDGLAGVKISFVGIFVWLEDLEPQDNYKDNASYKQKEMLKDINLDGLNNRKYNSFRFSRKKQAWYSSPKDYKQKFSSKKSLDQIKSTWGSKSFQPDQRKQLN